MYSGYCYLLLFLSLIVCSHGLFEDQIGKFDWHHHNIGRMRYADMRIRKFENRLIVCSHDNVLASLSPSTGDILWRQVLEKTQRGDVKLLQLTRPDEEQPTTAAARTSFDGNFEVLTVQGHSPALVRGWNANIGVIEFEWSLQPLQVERAADAFWFYRDSLLYHVLPIWGSHLEITRYVATSGQSPGKTSKVPASWIARNNCIRSDVLYVCTNGTKLISLDLAAYQPDITSVVISEELQGAIEMQKGLGDIVVANKKLININSGVRKCGHLSTGSYAKGYMGRRQIIVHADANGERLEINGYEGDQCIHLPNFNLTIPYSKHFGSPNLNMFECSGEVASSCSFLFDSSAESIFNVLNGKISWVREEALANIVDAQFIDLPLADSEGTLESEIKDKTEDSNLEKHILEAFFRRVGTQINQIRSLVLHITGFRAPKSESQKAGLVRDYFGLHQMLVVLTKCGKVFGIDNISGRRYWQHYLPNITGFNDMQGMRLLVQRSSKHFPLQPLCSVIGKDVTDGNGVLFRFNPITGAEDEGGSLKLNYRVKQLSLLAENDADYIKGLLIIDEQNRSHVYPNQAIKKADRLFMYFADLQTSEMNGFQIRYKAGKLITLPLWNIRLGGHDGEHKIVVIAEKNELEQVHSQGRVLADRSVLYKYVNPNMIAVLTYCNDGIQKGTLNLYLIDVVSGAVIHSITHRKVGLPVSIVHSENWLAYSYFNDKARRTEITSVELYEGKPQGNSSVWSSLSSTRAPSVERQSFILPTGVETMRETITERGITNKHILVGAVSGAVVELPWSFLDPRRPLTPTTETREEGIIPYAPELPLHSENTINYYQDIARLRKIYTAPSGLESTCLVLATGLDLYVTRVAPSKTFDLLKEDFDYITISAVLLALTAGSIIAKNLASRKLTAQAWK